MEPFRTQQRRERQIKDWKKAQLIRAFLYCAIKATSQRFSPPPIERVLRYDVVFFRRRATNPWCQTNIEHLRLMEMNVAFLWVNVVPYPAIQRPGPFTNMSSTYIRSTGTPTANHISENVVQCPTPHITNSKSIVINLPVTVSKITKFIINLTN